MLSLEGLVLGRVLLVAMRNFVDGALMSDSDNRFFSTCTLNNLESLHLCVKIFCASIALVIRPCLFYMAAAHAEFDTCMNRYECSVVRAL